MTRTLTSDLVISDALYRLVRATAPEDVLLERFDAPTNARLPGRARPLLIRVATA